MLPLSLSLQYTDEESDVDSFQTQPWSIPVLQRSFTVSTRACFLKDGNNRKT